MTDENSMIETLRTGDLIRHGRMSMGMTQAELAAYLAKQNSVFNGVDTVTISRWEAGRVYPSSKRLIAFAQTLYPQHTCTTLKHMIKDRPRGQLDCQIAKVNAFHQHPYLVGEAHRVLEVSHEAKRLTSGDRRCIDPFHTKMKHANSDTLTLSIFDPLTNEIFGHLLATTIDSDNRDSNQIDIAVTSIYAGSDKIFEYLMSQFFKFSVQHRAKSIFLVSSDLQQRSLAKRLGMTAVRATVPTEIQGPLHDRQADVFVGDYFDVLAHPDFIGLFSSDIAPYPAPTDSQADTSVEPIAPDRRASQ